MRLNTAVRIGVGSRVSWTTVVLSILFFVAITNQSPLIQQKATDLKPPESTVASIRSFSSNFNEKIGVIASVDYDVDGNCKALPFLRPAGTYFLNTDIKPARSLEAITPAFHVGSFLGERVKYHMLGDVPHFHVIKELLQGKEGGLTLDIGANQGFYTYYLASLGMEVHAFEINQNNFWALQHGAEYNSREVSERTHVYSIGLGTQTGRMSARGTSYDGHLEVVDGGSDGTIQTTSVDCFVYHNIRHLTNDIISNVAFVKIDVEGFEIAVLQGAKKSLFGPKGRIGGLIMEVGPSRWSRASVDFQVGVQEMKDLATHFQNSFIFVRTAGAFMKSCPTSLAQDHVKDTNPRILDGVNMFKVEMDEWEGLLNELNRSGGDCNFWYTN